MYVRVLFLGVEQLQAKTHHMHVPDEERDRAEAGTEYPTLVLYDVRLAISLTL